MPLAVRIFLPFIIFPIEIFSHAARVLSLTVRLFANMFAGEMVTLVFFSLIPVGVPLVVRGVACLSGVSFRHIFSCCCPRCTSARRWRMSTREGLSCQVSVSDDAVLCLGTEN